MAYQNLDLPKWIKFMPDKSKSSVCQQKKAFHAPT